MKYKIEQAAKGQRTYRVSGALPTLIRFEESHEAGATDLRFKITTGCGRQCTEAMSRSDLEVLQALIESALAEGVA